MAVLKHTVLVLLYKQEYGGNNFYEFRYIINNSNGTYNFTWSKDYYWYTTIQDFVQGNSVPQITVTTSYIAVDRNNYLDTLLQQNEKYVPGGDAIVVYDRFDTKYYLIKKVDPDESEEVRPFEINLQEKDVSITTNTTTTVEPDTGYQGLSEVVVTTNVTPELQNKTVSYTTNGTRTITPDSGYDGLSSVSCEVSVQENLQTKSFRYLTNGTRQIRPDSGYTGLSGVDVEVDVSPNLQNKQVWITNNGTSNYTPDSGYDGIGNIQVNVDVPTSGSTNYTLAHLNNNYTSNGTFTVDAPSGFDGFYSGGTITVNVPTSSGTTVNLESNKTVSQNDYINTHSNVIVTPSTGYDGLEQVTVEPIILDTGSYNTINSNGVTTIYPSTGSRGFLGSIAVDVNVPTPTVSVPECNYIAYGSPSNESGILNNGFSIVPQPFGSDESTEWWDNKYSLNGVSYKSLFIQPNHSIFAMQFYSQVEGQYKVCISVFANNESSTVEIRIPRLYDALQIRVKNFDTLIRYWGLSGDQYTNSEHMRISSCGYFNESALYYKPNTVIIWRNMLKFNTNYNN